VLSMEVISHPEAGTVEACHCRLQAVPSAGPSRQTLSCRVKPR
jgi:hypothetical protein